MGAGHREAEKPPKVTEQKASRSGCAPSHGAWSLQLMPHHAAALRLCGVPALWCVGQTLYPQTRNGGSERPGDFLGVPGVGSSRAGIQIQT